MEITLKNMSRSIRRHHFSRLKRYRKNYHGMDWVENRMHLGFVVNTATTCSCYVCGNPRKHLKERTVQELRFLQINQFTPE